MISATAWKCSPGIISSTSIDACSARASGGVNDDHVTVAAIIEMVHLATLVHDDVMDEAEIRDSQLSHPLAETQARRRLSCCESSPSWTWCRPKTSWMCV